ncbi:unnamed protein product [Urochloa humidicola]
MMFNDRLHQAVKMLNSELPGAQVMYSLVSATIANPLEYGFENVAQGCCGTGLIKFSLPCTLDGPLSCKDANKYLLFDAVHPTERLYKMEASEMLNTSLAVFL